MEFKNFTYMILLVGSISAPLLLSFDRKVQYYKNLKYIFPAIIVTAIIFWVWDIRFVEAQIWSFNQEYTIGVNLIGMPIEEWLFFIVVPYCCMFIYEVLKYYLQKYQFAHIFKSLSVLLIAVFALVSYFFRHQDYTFLTFLFSALYLSYTLIRNKFTPYITKFYFAFLVSLIPFLVVNGILTSLPVVKYNSVHILNIRIINIPIEDFSYLFLLLLMVTTIYETLKESRHY
ncbi:lycopene cyclase domain-containing protein [Aquipluma nitroreducens]|nr:lycopene cyclase domain-containing protein [Aquipluma nitroreducens]